MKIVFMGTPDIAAGVLDSLILAKYDIIGVVTQPDKPNQRGNGIVYSPVKQRALEAGLTVFQPVKASDESFVQVLRDLAPDVIVVVAFGQILKNNILSLPKYGCINAHASLLPKYRGAAPIQYALLNDEKTTGVSVMKLVSEMDAGDVLYTDTVDIEDEYDASYMFNLMGERSADAFSLVLSDIEGYLDKAVAQDPDKVTFAPPITTDMSWISFEDDARKAFCTIRAFCMNPCARIMMNGRQVIVTEAAYSTDSAEPGTVLSAKPLKIAFRNGSVVFKTVKPEGSKQMDGVSFAAGQRLKPGDVIR